MAEVAPEPRWFALPPDDVPRVPTTHGHRADDELLVQRVVHGDRSALGGLYDRYGKQAYSLARRITADDELGEDVVQEVFLAFWRAPRRFDPNRGSFVSWLLTIVHHKAVDAVRRERVVRRHTTTAPGEDEVRGVPFLPGADHAALDALAAGHVRAALAQLPVEQRQALGLAYFGGYTQREVAAIEAVPLGTVKSRMFSGLKRLRGILSPLLDDVVVQNDTVRNDVNGVRRDR